jgi:hypothetical protein
MCPDLPILPAMTKSFVTKGPNGNSDEIGEYKSLVKRLLSEVDARRFILEHSRYTRIKDGVLNIHSGEVMRFRVSHGCSTGTFDDSLFESELSEAETESYEKFSDTARSKQALVVRWVGFCNPRDDLKFNRYKDRAYSRELRNQEVS